VIIPIHNAPVELEVCLASLYRTLPAGAGVLLLDDASSDPRITAVLRHWLDLAGPSWRGEKQVHNLGFVGTANRGMEMTRGNVVLLNSDTVLTPGWLSGLQRCLESSPEIATATPWTNNGEIASLPGFCQNNPVPLDCDSVARLIATTGRALYPEIPTAVGFCMAISRRAIDTLGLFDQELFGLGYGEENDFSMRARNAGMKNVLCDDVYVGHLGGRSFAPKGLIPDESAMGKLLTRHPAYRELIRGFIAADPLAGRRAALVDALVRAGILNP
ncbi:MAG: glycosyltransferase family 2 protein, partial [Lysobacterales bacterium]